MPKKPGNKRSDRNPFKKGTEAGKIGDKAKKSKKKTQKVWLPVVIAKPIEEEPMTEAEISYKDALLAAKMERLAAKGLNNDQIIEELGIARSTFYDKLKNEPYFSYALMKHRDVADHNVENSLYNRAVGYKFLEKTTEAKPVKKVVNGQVITTYELMTAKVIEKEIPGDVKAQELWLTNRRPKEWKKNVEPSQQMPEGFGEIHFQLKRREE